MKREVAKDPWEARLKPISKDQLTKGNLPPWILRAYEADDYYVDLKTGKKNINNGTIVLKSLWW